MRLVRTSTPRDAFLECYMVLMVPQTKQLNKEPGTGLVMAYRIRLVIHGRTWTLAGTRAESYSKSIFTHSHSVLNCVILQLQIKIFWYFIWCVLIVFNRNRRLHQNTYELPGWSRNDHVVDTLDINGDKFQFGPRMKTLKVLFDA